MWRPLLLLVMGVAESILAAGQDINFSQFYELPLLRNPALAGHFEGDVRVTTAFRSQWNSVTVPYRTGALGAELRKPVGQSDDFLSLGAQVTYDVAGDSKLSRTQVLPMLAFHKSLSSERETFLTVGVLGGFVQQRFDPSRLRFSDQFVNGAYSAVNPTREVFNQQKSVYPDISAGLTLSGVLGEDARAYIGGAIFHISEPKVAFDPTNDIRLNRKFVVNAGLSAPFSNYDRIILYGDFFLQGGNRMFQGGLMLRKDLDDHTEELPVSLYFGAFYRSNDALVPVVRLDYHKLGFGFTYDVNVSKLKEASRSRGGLELTICFRDFLNSDKSTRYSTSCPKFDK
jgi:type IX secretion system PorP/SprF family membrane protein